MRNETVLLPPTTHQANSDTALGRSVFRIPCQGLLDLVQSRLIFGARTHGSNGATAGDLMDARYSTTAGGLGLIKSARLYLAGREISALQEAGHHGALLNGAMSQDRKLAMGSFESRQDARYSLDADGKVVGSVAGAIAPVFDSRYHLTNDSGTTPLCSVRLSELFGLNERQLPLVLVADGVCEVQIEWDFDVKCLGWAKPTTSAATAKSFRVVAPVMSAEVVFHEAKKHVADQMENAKQSGKNGLSWSFPRTVYARKNLNTSVAEPAFTQRYNQNGAKLLAMFAAFEPSEDLDETTSGKFISRALGNQAATWQLRINDLQTLERPLDNTALQWSHLSDAMGKAFVCSPGQFSAMNPERVAAASTEDKLGSANYFGLKAPEGVWNVGPSPIELQCTRAGDAAFVHSGALHSWFKTLRTISFAGQGLKIGD